MVVLMSNSNAFHVGALGDSISVAYNADASGNNDSHSWSTGDLELASGASHLMRIRGLYPQLVVKANNVAVVGARSADLKSQVDRLLQAVSRPDYVTLMIGANDLTSWLSDYSDSNVLNFVSDVKSAISRLVAANPRIMILLVGVPDQSRVVTLLAKQRFGAQMASILENLMQRPDLNVMLNAYKVRWNTVNRALNELAATHSAHVRYSGAATTAVFSDEHLSKHDFYHPSILGQRLLAEVTWREGFFP